MSTTDSEARLLILAFDHPLRAVESVGQRMAHALQTLGVATQLLVVPRDLPRLLECTPGEVGGVLSLGSPPLACLPDGTPLWERFAAVPVTVYLLDAIIYDIARVPIMSRFIAAAQRDDRLAVLSPEDGYRRWLGPCLGVRWSHLPFAALAQLMPGSAAVQPQNRWCVVGTIGQELGGAGRGEGLPDLLRRTLPDSIGNLQLDRLHQALLAPDAHAMPVHTVCDALGWSAADAVQAQRLPLLLGVDSWVKRQRRLAAAQSLRGLAVDFFGDGWAEALGEVPEFRYVGNVAHADIARLVPHYRGLVNFDPNWSAGAHDRVYTSTAIGVPVMTNQNTALDDAALPGELVLRYDANEPRLADLARASGHTRPPQPAAPRHDVLLRHNWAQRMAAWLVSSTA